MPQKDIINIFGLNPETLFSIKMKSFIIDFFILKLNVKYSHKKIRKDNNY